jgi:putative protease
MIARVRGVTVGTANHALRTQTRVPAGWRVLRTSHARLLAEARESYRSLEAPAKARKNRLDVRVFGSVGAQLKVLFSSVGECVEVRSEAQLVPAAKRALDHATLREQLGRLGETPFVLASIDDLGLGLDLFLPISELNQMRQRAVSELLLRRDWAADARRADREQRIVEAIERLDDTPPTTKATGPTSTTFTLSAQVYRIEDAEQAAAAGASEIVLDPFVRHPPLPLARVRALARSLEVGGVALRIRTPTIVRPAERRALQKWLDLGLPILTGHLGLVAELGRDGRDVIGDYALNVMNEHTAALLFGLGARRIVLSVELTTEEINTLVARWGGARFDVFLYGRPEGMTIEHCVLSAAFDREPTTCRDLCVQKHTNVTLTDPAGYAFPLATDSACRNRLLHSRPIEGSEFLPRLWSSGIRGYHLVFNVPGEPVRQAVSAYRVMLDGLVSGDDRATTQTSAMRSLVGPAFTRGHFARAV